MNQNTYKEIRSWCNEKTYAIQVEHCSNGVKCCDTIWEPQIDLTDMLCKYILKSFQNAEKRGEKRLILEYKKWWDLYALKINKQLSGILKITRYGNSNCLIVTKN